MDGGSGTLVGFECTVIPFYTVQRKGGTSGLFASFGDGAVVNATLVNRAGGVLGKNVGR